MAEEFSHLDENGRMQMVDVGGKEPTERVATAVALVVMESPTRDSILAGELRKGDVLAAARVAGIMAAKRTADLIPLCHPVSVTSVKVDLEPADRGISISAEVSTRDRTGVEMEALTAVSVAALTVYDMIKGIDRGAFVEGIKLLAKSGGRSGEWTR